MPEITYWTVPLGVALTTVLLPCQLCLLGSSLLCGIGDSSSISKCLVAAMEFVMALQLIISASHYAVFYQISGIVLLWGKCEEFMASKGRNVDFLVKGYRHLQLLEKIHNFSFRGRILPATVWGIPSLQILSGFALIALFGNASFIQVSIFLTIYIDACMCGLVIFSAAACIHVITEDWVARVKPRGGKQVRYFRRIHKSFRPLRLEFGNNFVDRLTPLVMQEFCVRQTASFLLLGKV